MVKRNLDEIINKFSKIKEKLYNLKIQILKDSSIKEELKKDIVEQIFRIEQDIAKNNETTNKLLLSGVVSSATKCNHKSQKDSLSYLKWIDFADNEIANGREQVRCPKCYKWLFPSEV